MRRTGWRVAMVLSAAVLAGATAGAVMIGSAAIAGASPTSHTVLSGTLLPSEPNSPKLHGVVTDTAPWVLRGGTVKVRSNGEVLVKIKNLLIPSLGTAGPVATVDASIYCGEETTAAATTPPSPLSSSGDATIAATVALPSKCFTPTILINPNGNAASYVAVSGFGMYG